MRVNVSRNMPAEASGSPADGRFFSAVSGTGRTFFGRPDALEAVLTASGRRAGIVPWTPRSRQDAVRVALLSLHESETGAPATQ